MEERFKDEKLISVKELAYKWGKNEDTIRRYITEGVITPCKDVPGIMFHPKYISKLEGVELERFSPLEKKRLENENRELKKRITQLKSVLTNILRESSKIVDLTI